MCCSVLQCVAVCCSVLQCVAVCCSVLLRITHRLLSKPFRHSCAKAYAQAALEPLSRIQHTATHCNTLLMHCNTLLHTATPSAYASSSPACVTRILCGCIFGFTVECYHSNTSHLQQHTATHCNNHCNTRQHTECQHSNTCHHQIMQFLVQR